jgi:hypothetical protein
MPSLQQITNNQKEETQINEEFDWSLPPQEPGIPQNNISSGQIGRGSELTMADITEAVNSFRRVEEIPRSQPLKYNYVSLSDPITKPKKTVKKRLKSNIDPDSTQKIYKVRIYKDFYFPSFSVNKNAPLGELTLNAIDEIKENFEDEGYFEAEVLDILPFNFREEAAIPELKIGTGTLIRELAFSIMEQKYGKLDPTVNKDLFEEINDLRGDMRIQFYLRGDIEKEYSKLLNTFYNIEQTLRV